MNVHDVLHSMPDVGNWRKLRYRNGTNTNIIEVLESNFPEACRITKRAAKLFKGATDTESAENVWDFLKQHITYKADGTRSQDIRLPNRLLADGTGDCKSFALFAASILANLGVPVGFRYVSFRKSKTPTHVYAIADDEEGNEIIIDAVWKYFNREHSYTSKQDSTMEVATMGAVSEDMTVDRAYQIVTRLREKLNTLPVQSGERGSIREHIARLTQWLQSQVIGSFKTFAFAIPRNAFLELVRLNIFKLGSHVKTGIQRNEKKVKEKWEKLGGDFKKLKAAAGASGVAATDYTNFLNQPAFQNNSVEQNLQILKDNLAKAKASGNAIQITVAANLLIQYMKSHGLAGIGILPPAVVAAIATAVPVLGAMVPILKQICPEAAADLEGYLNEAKAAGLSFSDPTLDPNFNVNDDESKGFQFSSIPVWGWGLGAAAVGYVLFKS